MSTMECLHCATKIPVMASICPHCHSETKNSQIYNIKMSAASTLSVIAGAASAVFLFKTDLCSAWWGMAVLVGVLMAFAPRRPVLETHTRSVRIEPGV